MYLSRMYLGLNDTGAATRWALLTQADDILGQHSKGGGAGSKMLLTILGMAEDELSDFNSVASDNLNRVLKGGDWCKPEAFAEDVIVRFALSRPEASHLLAANSAVSEYPLSSPYLASLLHAVDSGFGTTKGKGDLLEDLATYLFLLIPSFSPRRNVKDIFDTFETDIVVRNLSTSADPLAEILGRHILVECKNWKDPVGVSDVGYFLYRMRLTHVAFGVIFAANDITGSSTEEKAARSIIRKAFHEDGSICVIINKSDLEDLQSKSSSFKSFLLEKAEQVRFGKALYSS